VVRSAPYLEHESDLDVDAQIEQLARENDAKLPRLKILKALILVFQLAGSWMKARMKMI
jgi:hypothetical protein